MSYENLVLINQIKIAINEHYPLVSVNCFYDPINDELEIGISNKEVYYSDEYQQIVTRLNLEILWPKNITNILFIYDESFDYYSSFIFSDAKVSTRNAASWEYHQTSFDCSNLYAEDDYPKAA